MIEIKQYANKNNNKYKANPHWINNHNSCMNDKINKKESDNSKEEYLKQESFILHLNPHISI